MIAQANRFHGYGSVRAVYRRGEQVRGQYLSLTRADRIADKPYRMAVVVSRKVHKSAVVRNRIRRRLFETARAMPTVTNSHQDLVFTVFQAKLLELDSSAVAEAMDKLLVQPTRTPVKHAIVKPVIPKKADE